MPPLRVLVLGGSSEATVLATALQGMSDVFATLSLAGRTRAPGLQPLPLRVGGFGGVDGLCDHLRAERIDLLVDATHPFAVQMTRHAREASQRVGVPLLAISRPAWEPQMGDRWTQVAHMSAAVDVLGALPCRVFLTVGRLQLAAFAAAPQHDYLVRTIDPIVGDVGLPRLRVIEARGPFEVAAEERLMRDHRTDVLVTKNSGGTASAPKLEAARRLGLPVILVCRPDADRGVSVDEAITRVAALARK